MFSLVKIKIKYFIPGWDQTFSSKNALSSDQMEFDDSGHYQILNFDNFSVTLENNLHALWINLYFQYRVISYLDLRGVSWQLYFNLSPCSAGTLYDRYISIPPFCLFHFHIMEILSGWNITVNTIDPRHNLLPMKWPCKSNESWVFFIKFRSHDSSYNFYSLLVQFIHKIK